MQYEFSNTGFSTSGVKAKSDLPDCMKDLVLKLFSYIDHASFEFARFWLACQRRKVAIAIKATLQAVYHAIRLSTIDMGKWPI